MEGRQLILNTSGTMKCVELHSMVTTIRHTSDTCILSLARSLTSSVLQEGPPGSGAPNNTPPQAVQCGTHALPTSSVLQEGTPRFRSSCRRASSCPTASSRSTPAFQQACGGFGVGYQWISEGGGVSGAGDCTSTAPESAPPGPHFHTSSPHPTWSKGRRQRLHSSKVSSSSFSCVRMTCSGPPSAAPPGILQGSGGNTNRIGRGSV